MLDLAQKCFADTPDIAHIEVGELSEHCDVVLSMTTHRMVVVSGAIKAIDENEVAREVALVIPRRFCTGDRPSASALLQAACDAVMQNLVRQPAKCIEMLINTRDGLPHRLLRVQTQNLA